MSLYQYRRPSLADKHLTNWELEQAAQKLAEETKEAKKNKVESKKKNKKNE